MITPTTNNNCNYNYFQNGNITASNCKFCDEKRDSEKPRAVGM